MSTRVYIVRPKSGEGTARLIDVRKAIEGRYRIQVQGRVRDRHAASSGPGEMNRPRAMRRHYQRVRMPTRANVMITLPRRAMK